MDATIIRFVHILIWEPRT